MSGVLIAIGLLSPLGELGVIASMLMAIITAHWPRFFVTKNGIEYPLVLLVTALAVAISGPGVYSLDAVLRLAPPEPVTLIGGRQPSEELQVTVRPGRQLAKVSFSQPNASGRPPR